MRTTFTILCSMLWLAPAAAAAPGLPTLDSFEPTTAIRGGVIAVKGQGFKDRKLRVWLGGHDIGAPAAISEDGQTFAFLVPSASDKPFVPLGKHTVRVQLLDPPAGTIAFKPGNGQLTLESDVPLQPKVVTVVPRVSYHDQEKFTLLVSGEGFSPVPADNILVMNGREVRTCWSPAPEPCDQPIRGSLSASGRELQFAGFTRSEHQGLHQVKIRVGGVTSDPSHASFSLVSRGSPRWISLFVAVTLLSLLLGLIWVGARQAKQMIDGERYGVLRMMFLDPGTNTYSLSKFQFILWTMAAVFGYAFLTVSKTLIQGDLVFPDFPDNLPGIILISATTTVTVVGVTEARGSKGSGSVRPSIADFVTTGGVVVAERFQYLIWTLVAVATFLMLIVLSDPADLSTLPTVPETFLYLMGISSFGYVAGKIARKPGPVVNTVIPSQGGLKLEIRGRNLSPDARFSINDVDVTPMMGESNDTTGLPVIVEKDRRTPENPFAKAIKIHLRRIHPDWLADAPASPDEPLKLTLTVCNPDGQKSEFRFDVEPELRAHLTQMSRGGKSITEARR